MRPFKLIPKAAIEVATPTYLDKDGKVLPADAPGELVAESVYDIRIKPGILFQPHPAFAKDEQGRHRYHAMKPGELGERRTPLDFEHSGTRELVADDYVYALKRHATTRITTPIYGIFSEYVLGLKEYGQLIRVEDKKLRAGLDPASQDKPFLDFRRWPLIGASAPEKDLLRIRIKGKYPQWNYWMSMTFMAPVPWEADAFYAQPGMAAVGLSLDTWPVGTGPYMMTEFIKDRRHVLKRNPNFRGEPYPCEGMPGDKEAGLLDDCGKTMPFIDSFVSTVEREAVPQHGKFRQGFYDIEVFERTDTGMDYIVAMQDSEEVRKEYEAKGFRLPRFADVSSWIVGFNMLDPTIGWGDTPEQQARNRKLRQAISIAFDWEEYSKIFPKTGGETAMSPLPQGIFGSRHGTPEGHNPVTHKLVDGKVVKRSIEEAKQLLAEAGYPNGRDAKTGKPLVINYDYYAPATPERKPGIDWVVRQFAKLDIQLEVRATDNNQFQDKVRKGKYQVYWLGWLADYPDAENFLFLLYGPNGKTKHRRREHRQLRQPGIRQAVRADEAAGRRAREAGGDRPHGADRPAGRAVELRLLSLCLRRGPVLGAQLQARGADPRPWQVPAPGRGRARAASWPNGTGRCGGRWCSAAWWCWRWPGWAGAACAGASAPTHAARSSPDGVLRRPAHRLRRAHPAGREPGHLLPVLHRQHAGRHGAAEHRRQAREPGSHRQVEGRARLRQAAVCQRRESRHGEDHRHHLLGTLGVACSRSTSGAPTPKAPATSATRWPRACGSACNWRCRCSCCRSSPARPSRCCWRCSATPSSTSGAW